MAVTMVARWPIDLPTYVCLAVGLFFVQICTYIHPNISTPATPPHNPSAQLSVHRLRNCVASVIHPASFQTHFHFHNDLHFYDFDGTRYLIIGNVIDSSAAVVRNDVTWRRDGSSPVVAARCNVVGTCGEAQPCLRCFSNVHFYFILLTCHLSTIQV